MPSALPVDAPAGASVAILQRAGGRPVRGFSSSSCASRPGLASALRGFNCARARRFSARKTVSQFPPARRGRVKKRLTMRFFDENWSPQQPAGRGLNARSAAINPLEKARHIQLSQQCAALNCGRGVGRPGFDRANQTLYQTPQSVCVSCGDRSVYRGPHMAFCDPATGDVLSRVLKEDIKRSISSFGSIDELSRREGRPWLHAHVRAAGRALTDKPRSARSSCIEDHARSRRWLRPVSAHSRPS